MLKLLVRLTRKFYNITNKKYEVNARKKYWNNEFKKNIHNTYNLTKEEKKQIIDFYKPYVKINSLFHEFYLQKTGKFSKYYIPDDIYYTIIDPYFNNWNEALYLDNKCYYDKIFYNIAQPFTIVKRMNNVWLDDKNKIVNADNVRTIIQNNEKLFLKKATESEGGHGVFFIKNIDDFDDVINKIDGDIVIQKELKQSRILNRLNSSSVNTIRVLTLLRNNDVKIYSTVLRMGINGAKVDNASSGGITCGIKENGQLKDIAYSSKGDRYYEHPTSKVKFSEIIIPNFDKVYELVKETAKTIPHFRLVSWDIAIDENDEPILIEANLRYGELDFHQLNNGPLFKEDTEEILKEVFNKK